MPLDTSNPADAVEGDVVRGPVYQSCVYLVFGVFAVGIGFATFYFLDWVGFLAEPSTSSEPNIALFFRLLGLAVLLIGGFCCWVGYWQLDQRPRWVIGAGRLQYVVGPAAKPEVWWNLPYANLEAAELCKPGLGLEPFIGLRLYEPQPFPRPVPPYISRDLLQRLGYDYRIAKVECDIPLRAVHEKLIARLNEWRRQAAPPEETSARGHG